MITHEELLRCLSYDADTGVFKWKACNKPNWNARYAGTIAGTVSDNGYLIISLRGFRYRAHRLAWYYVNGSMPCGDIDHLNRDRLDNRICNLRDVGRSVNLKNSSLRGRNKTGVCGVFKRKDCNSYLAYAIGDDGVKVSKTFCDFFEAVCFRKSIESKMSTYI